MTPFVFDTATLPPEQRLPAFRLGASDYAVDAVGDPLAFAAHWTMLKFGDLNAILARVSPVHYCRDWARIEADGEDRIAVHCYLGGSTAGMVDERPARAGPGEAMIWDLSRPIETVSEVELDLVILTLPRYMLAEVLPDPALAGVIGPSPELALLVQHVRHLFDCAAELPEESAPFYGRAIRDMVAVAALPAYRAVRPIDAQTAPLLQRVCDLIDDRLQEQLDEEAVALALAVPRDRLAQTLGHFGGLELQVERRRLLAAYRLLCDPAETAPIATIAWRCGFDSMPTFSNRFRVVFQTSPSDLRRHHRGYLPRWAGAYHVEKDYGALLAS